MTYEEDEVIFDNDLIEVIARSTRSDKSGIMISCHKKMEPFPPEQIMALRDILSEFLANEGYET